MERENVKFLKNSKTIDFTMFQDATTVFLTMYRNENHQKVPPRQILKSNYAGQTHIISFHHKDAIGRETEN